MCGLQDGRQGTIRKVDVSVELLFLSCHLQCFRDRLLRRVNLIHYLRVMIVVRTDLF